MIAVILDKSVQNVAVVQVSTFKACVIYFDLHPEILEKGWGS